MKSTLVVSLASLILLSGLALGQPVKTDPPAAPKATAPMKKIEPAPASAPAKKEATLKVGDKAPPIVVGTWIKGDAVKSLDAGKVYVVEFWATWCPPCRESIPHLTQLAKDNKSVTFMSIAASERKDKGGSDTRLENLKSFVEKQGSKMEFHVGYDPDRAMGRPWMEAAGMNSIPTAFIVGGDGKISWMGHPMDLEEPLAAAVKAAKPAKTATKSDKPKKQSK